MTRSGIQRAVTSVFTHLAALFFAGVSGSIVAVMAAYVLFYCIGLPLFLAAGLLGGSIGEGALFVCGIALIAFSLLAGLTIGTEVYIGVALPEDRWNGPTPGWLRALWAAAAGALVGALPCAVGVDWFVLGPAQAAPAAGALATHLVGLGALTGALTGITMERFRIWRWPHRETGARLTQLARPALREADTASRCADRQPALLVDHRSD